MSAPGRACGYACADSYFVCVWVATFWEIDGLGTADARFPTLNAMY